MIKNSTIALLLLLSTTLVCVQSTSTAWAAETTTAAVEPDTRNQDADHVGSEASDESGGFFGDIATLAMLVLLQIVLGFDNLLYISLESKRVPADKQSYVRRLGIGVAIGLRIVLLFVIVNVVAMLEESFASWDWGFISAAVSGHSLIVLFGGAFIIYTATKEIFHMLAVHDVTHGHDSSVRSVGKAIFWIVLMNLVFSFDSILSAMALTKTFWVMATAIVLSGLLMIFLADHVANFLQKNRMYEVLGLFILFIVGIMLVSEGGHLAHVKLFGSEVHPMTKTTFYFVLVVLILTDIVQGRYQKKLLAMQEAEAGHA